MVELAGREWVRGESGVESRAPSIPAPQEHWDTFLEDSLLTRHVIHNLGKKLRQVSSSISRPMFRIEEHQPLADHHLSTE